MAITSRQLDASRKQANRIAARFELEAKKVASSEPALAAAYEKQAAVFRSASASSLVGRKGTKAERQERMEQAAESLAALDIAGAKKSMTKTGRQAALQSAREKRQNQEAAFNASMKMHRDTAAKKLRKNASAKSRAAHQQAHKNIDADRAFFAMTRQYWKGAATPQERLNMIVKGTGTTNIFEAYNKVMSEAAEQEAILSRDLSALKNMGWSNERLAQAKNVFDAADEQGDSPVYEFMEQLYMKGNSSDKIKVK